MKNDTAASYTPAAGGRILFIRNDNLYSQRLDLGARRLSGDPELLAQGVASSPTFRYGSFSASRGGVTAWRPGRAWASQVTVFDRQGKVTATAGSPSPIISAKLSPDEHRILLSTFNGQSLVEPNQSGNLRVRRGGGSMTMLWSPDGSHFLIPDSGRILERPVNDAEGSKEHERELARAPGLDRLEDVSPDGKTILFTSGALSAAVYSVRLEGPPAERAPKPVLQTGERAFHTRFSPDGRWILYELYSEQAGGGGIYVQPFPGPGLRKQIARDGFYPVWRKDGKEILFLESEGARDRLWSIRVESTGTDLRFSSPEKLFLVGQLEGGVSDINQLAVSRDGSRIFYPQAAEQPDSNVIHLRMGWGLP